LLRRIRVFVFDDTACRIEGAPPVEKQVVRAQEHGISLVTLSRAELFLAEGAKAAGRYVCYSLVSTTVLELARFLELAEIPHSTQSENQSAVRISLLLPDSEFLRFC
jgi:hypothetical protein